MKSLKKFLVAILLLSSTPSFAWYLCEDGGNYFLVCKDGTEFDLGYGPPQRVTQDDINKCGNHGGLAAIGGPLYPLAAGVLSVVDPEGKNHTGFEAKNIFLNLMKDQIKCGK